MGGWWWWSLVPESEREREGRQAGPAPPARPHRPRLAACEAARRRWRCPLGGFGDGCLRWGEGGSPLRCGVAVGLTRGAVAAHSGPGGRAEQAVGWWRVEGVACFCPHAPTRFTGRAAGGGTWQGLPPRRWSRRHRGRGAGPGCPGWGAGEGGEGGLAGDCPLLKEIGLLVASQTGVPHVFTDQTKAQVRAKKARFAPSESPNYSLTMYFVSCFRIMSNEIFIKPVPWQNVSQ